MNKDIKVYFENPYPDEERMRRRLLYWQNAPQQRLEDRCKVLFFLMYSISSNLFSIVESSDSEASANEEMVEVGTSKQTEETAGDPFWILDLNPDMQS
jgi:hypothetical protein